MKLKLSRKSEYWENLVVFFQINMDMWVKCTMRYHVISAYMSPAEPKEKEQLFSAPGTAQQLSKGLFHIQLEQSAV